MGVLILTHRRLLVSQFNRELAAEGYGDRLTPIVEQGQTSPQPNPITVQTYAWFARHHDSVSRDTYQLVIADEAHTALGEKTSHAIRSFPEPDLHRDDRDRAADREAGLGRLPGLGRRPAAPGRGPARADRSAPQPARAAGRRDPLRADRRRRLRGARARRGARPHGAEPGRREPLPRPVRLDAGHRLRRGRRPRVQPRPGVPRRRAEGRGGQRADAAGQARRDPRRLRARRDRHPDQRDAARRGLELASRDRRHAPRPDREPARLPAADRPDHAHAPAQGGRHRRRLREQGRDAQRPRGLAPLAARRRLLPRGRPRDSGAAPPAEPPRAAQALARAVARAGDARRAPPPRGHPARVAADRPALPRRGRAALLGVDRRAARCGSRSAPSS